MGDSMENTRYYKIGGLVFSLQGPAFHESSYLVPFRCDPPAADIRFHISAGHPEVPASAVCTGETLHTAQYLCGDRSLTVFWREGTLIPLLTRQQISEDQYEVCLEESCLQIYDTNLVLKLLDLPQLLLKNGGIFLHASFIETQGTGILFTAQKQVGKSTQAALWEKYRQAEIINGDRALLRQIGGKWMACGSPYCGTSDICKNRYLPLRAIVILQQGPENNIRSATARETAAAFLSGCTYHPETQTETILDFALALWSSIPVYCFSCLPDETAVACLEKTLGI